jgi:hypothetical protein
MGKNSPLYDESIAVLSIMARQVDDLEAMREAIRARVRQLTNDKADKDEQQRGLGIPADAPQVVQLIEQADAIHALEKTAVRQLEFHLRRSMWGPWQKQAVGVGEKQLARLLGTLIDPAWNSNEGRYRTVDELFVYCGYSSVPAGGQAVGNTQQENTTSAPRVAPHHRKGVQSKWSPEARMRAHLIAEKCMMQRDGNKYRDVYVAGRAKYADAVHAVPCQQCAGKGKTPHPAGSPLRDGHMHARALRLVAKAVLKDLWRESRRLHGFHPDEVVRRNT